jgi:hypothetical protein
MTLQAVDKDEKDTALGLATTAAGAVDAGAAAAGGAAAGGCSSRRLQQQEPGEEPEARRITEARHVV